ncbi:Protein of unknown function [Cryobacterium flavum]|uniref:DUF3073 domain-containing protein n=1 Tax=Cryobacterium flavum TaxID=1424659 RepID=A0A4R8V6B6_9MICO|nr:MULTISPECIES: DUF3073 domain-containing protein [Cryobacterium]TFB77461.1 DUF3073 domain-containing protein [Cryobacterium flavum]TFD09860.1 DUF3073 domain-containing protein [Cryobacterium sp. TMT1-66-1]TFD14247.1 DUF3073 domain-containing protein [Cryobacterium sp. TMT1-2-2]SDM44934.1 Protein of unknown function [Cryobacterium flavum]
MGRGRQKAKHTKVARELKYFSPDTNYNALERELTGHPSDPRLDEDLAKWPEYEADKAKKSADAGTADSADDDDDPDGDDDRYVDHYATEDEKKRA